MLVASIDIMGGRAVQLIGGKEKAINAGDPLEVARRFRLAGELAVIDLDAAMGRGSNAAIVKRLIGMAPCRVGGGIRTAEAALDWLDAGAQKVILGTAATPEVLSQLPRERTIAALDADCGEVVVDGWQTKTGTTIEQRMAELKELVGGFLVTFVEREGRMQGIDLSRAKELKELAGDAALTVAGGVTSTEELAALDGAGMDAQVGMAIYSGALPLADAAIAPLLVREPEGLWPTVVVDEHGIALGLAWSNLKSVRKAFELRRGVYHSRTRGLWIKGESSGATQDLLRVDLDCDRDALRFTVRQRGDGFCHRNTRTCWGDDAGLTRLMRTMKARMHDAPAGSYTRRLLDDPALLHEKIREEAEELCEAAGRDAVVWEAADVMYFTLAKLAAAGIGLEDVERELGRRALAARRRSDTATESGGEC